MRVALLHNPSAGSEDHTDASLARLIDRAGHELVHVVESFADLAAALQRVPCELVAVAGGDGTVGKVACELSNWGVPVAILPLGTANNTALTLGLSKPLKALIGRWAVAERVPFDIAFLDDRSVKQRFCEGVGWGAFPLTVAEAKQSHPKRSTRRKLGHDRKLFRSVVARTEARPYQIEVDGQDCSGSYVMVQVMNVPLIGPRLLVSPESDPSDGQLELVLATDKDRAMLHELGKKGGLQQGMLRTVRGRRFRVLASDGLMHIDGRLLRHPPGVQELEVSTRNGAVVFLR